MGIGQQIIKVYQDLFEKIDIKSVNKVCEIGRQNLTINKNIDDEIKFLFHQFNRIPSQKILGIAPEDNWGVRAKIFYEELGLDYFSLDIDNEEKNEDSKTNLAIDINYEKLPKDHYSKYDLVTNFGTSEHIFNQLNFFEIMHQLTAVNGIMISEVPCMFGIDHGMYKYEPKFFTDIARSNAYNVLDFYLVPDPPNIDIYKWDENVSITQCKNMCIIAILQKTNDKEFCVPLCGEYELKIKKDVLANYNYNSEGNLISGDKAYYILREKNNLTYLDKKILFKEILRRFLKKIKFN